jgi:hypothetical protein
LYVPFSPATGTRTTLSSYQSYDRSMPSRNDNARVISGDGFRGESYGP